MTSKTRLTVRIRNMFNCPLGRRNLRFFGVDSISFGPIIAYCLGRFGYPLLGLRPVRGWFCGSCAASGSLGLFGVRSPSGCILSAAILTFAAFAFFVLCMVIGCAVMSEARYRQALAWRSRKARREEASGHE